VGKRVQFAGLLLVLWAGLSGCVTAKLWEQQAFDGLNQPARLPNLQVYKIQNDWLIEYDEANEKNDRIRRRAYYLNENQTAIDAHKPAAICPQARDSLIRSSASSDLDERSALHVV
jgi:hypothetical protein